MSAIKLFLVLAATAAQVMAQAPPETSTQFQVIIDTGDSALPDFLASFLQPRQPPCRQAIQNMPCEGAPREVAICLAESSEPLSDACTTLLFQEALSLGDTQVLEMLAPKVQAMLSKPDEKQPLVVPAEPEQQHTNGHHKGEHHSSHHKNDGHVHPIVEHLREACATEFGSGTCSFAVEKKKVCPRKLLHCLVQHRKELGDQCTLQARTEITRITRNDHSPMHMAISMLAWVLILLALFACCRCCMRCIFMCCNRSVPQVGVETDVIVNLQPSAPVMSEDEELEMVLMLSAAEAKGEKIVDGIPVHAHDQV